MNTQPKQGSGTRNVDFSMPVYTPAALLTCCFVLGQGDKNAADQAAVDMMRKVLATVQMNGIVVIGEGEKDVRNPPPPPPPLWVFPSPLSHTFAQVTFRHLTPTPCGGLAVSAPY